jgi:glycosyltransferase involved in cell wall biosynthesis
MSDSIHAARWINQVADQGWDIHLFPSIDYGATHQDLKNITVYHSIFGVKKNRNTKVTYSGYPIFSTIIAWGSRLILKLFSPDYRDKQLRKIISQLKPDIIHSMEFQSAGYMVLKAKNESGNKFPVWIATNWGSDIFYFSRFSRHREKIREILKSCDYYSCECERDVILAKKLGLAGKTLPVLPNAGGFDLGSLEKFRQPGKTSERRVILLKGYQGWAGRSLIGLRAIGLCVADLRNYHIMIYSCNSREVKKQAGAIAQKTGLRITVVPACSHEEIIRMFGSARVYIGLSISDAISTSLLESIVMGAFPIQSDTSCGDEWIIPEQNGFLVPPESPGSVALFLRRALADDDLVNQAAAINEKIARERLDYSVIQQKVIEQYKNIAASSGRHQVSVER